MKNTTLQEKEYLSNFAGVVHALTILSQGILEDGSHSDDMQFHLPSRIEDNHLLAGLASEILSAYEEADLDTDVTLFGFVEQYVLRMLKE